MYSDDWHKAGYKIENRIPVAGPVCYRHAYDQDGNSVGVIVDFEYADDYHYELLADDWQKFCEIYLDPGDEVDAFKRFITAKDLESFEGKFAFEFALKAADITFKKMAYF